VTFSAQLCRYFYEIRVALFIFSCPWDWPLKLSDNETRKAFTVRRLCETSLPFSWI